MCLVTNDTCARACVHVVEYDKGVNAETTSGVGFHFETRSPGSPASFSVLPPISP